MKKSRFPPLFFQQSLNTKVSNLWWGFLLFLTGSGEEWILGRKRIKRAMYALAKNTRRL